MDDMKIKRPLRWDKKWRVVTYDIPEKKASLRRELAAKLQALGFFEIQRSVWVHPFECTKELNFLIKLYGADTYVRTMLVDRINSDRDIRTHFHLN